MCTAIVVYSLWKAFTFAEAQRQKIYVLDGGKSLMLALSQDLSQNRPVEAREHVKRFHELFFTLSPDKNAIESNIRRALFLVDKSAFAYYKDLTERVITTGSFPDNINQAIQVDSVMCDFDSYPTGSPLMQGKMIIRESNVTERSLITHCNLINSVRSDNNPARLYNGSL
jgi:conjugative transposon TraK protein